MIKIYQNKMWNDVDDIDIINNYQLFKNSLDNKIQNNDYTLIKDGYYKTYIIKDDVKLSIVDWNDVKVFLCDIPKPKWCDAKPYQTWAFYDFLCNNKIEEIYASKNSWISNYVEIPYNDISPNIIFKISYNENGSISYEKDDDNKTRIRMSNNHHERTYYQGFYNRITSDIF
jgi:hypothetical protein